jgi:acyl-CoA synthetase (AMP-forming)/AMP-acid ligase II
MAAVFNSQTYRDWMGFTAEDSVLGVAPLFHITGLIGHMGVALLAGCPLVINHRFEAGVVIDAIREHQPTFTVGSITVFINLSGLEGVARDDWSSFRMIYSGARRSRPRSPAAALPPRIPRRRTSAAPARNRRPRGRAAAATGAQCARSRQGPHRSRHGRSSA